MYYLGLVALIPATEGTVLGYLLAHCEVHVQGISGLSQVIR